MDLFSFGKKEEEAEPDEKTLKNSINNPPSQYGH